ncbi:uncharacterized protein EV420DRAFT_1565501, partial [Desarmillaria tabescens]
MRQLSTRYPERKSRAQTAFLISSSCTFPKSSQLNHVALLEILCCSGRYAFTVLDTHSRPETFFANAIRCFLSSCSSDQPQSDQYESERCKLLELDVFERILGPFFNQGYIVNRGHIAQEKSLRFFGPYFELKDYGILLKIFVEEGGLQALHDKFKALLSRSATPTELVPTTGLAHLIANRMIETNTLDPLHLIDTAKKHSFIDSLSNLTYPASVQSEWQPTDHHQSSGIPLPEEYRSIDTGKKFSNGCSNGRSIKKFGVTYIGENCVICIISRIFKKFLPCFLKRRKFDWTHCQSLMRRWLAD